jgi:hypothetical protein
MKGKFFALVVLFGSCFFLSKDSPSMVATQIDDGNSIELVPSGNVSHDFVVTAFEHDTLSLAQPSVDVLHCKHGEVSYKDMANVSRYSDSESLRQKPPLLGYTLNVAGEDLRDSNRDKPKRRCEVLRAQIGNDASPPMSIGEFLRLYWGKLLLSILGVVELIVRLTPTDKDNSIFNLLYSIINAIIPNLRAGGGLHD